VAKKVLQGNWEVLCGFKKEKGSSSDGKEKVQILVINTHINYRAVDSAGAWQETNCLRKEKGPFSRLRLHP